MTIESPRQPRAARRRGLLEGWTCAVFGHEMDNRTLTSKLSHPRCSQCREPFLFEDGRVTHTRHVLGCLFRHHTYVRIGARQGHHEYTCLRCGHPLLFEAGRDPYANEAVFAKKVRYLCNLFGHGVHAVGDRHGLTEYACRCGHSFLRAARDLKRVTHPLACTVSGHRVVFVEARGPYREHRCLECGHTFGVTPPPRSSATSTPARGWRVGARSRRLFIRTVRHAAV